MGHSHPGTGTAVSGSFFAWASEPVRKAAHSATFTAMTLSSAAMPASISNGTPSVTASRRHRHHAAGQAQREHQQHGLHRHVHHRLHLLCPGSMASHGNTIQSLY